MAGNQLLLLYFSGTGNTEFVARQLACALKAKRIACDLKAVESCTSLNLVGYDGLVFGFPVYACDLPSHVQRFIEKSGAVQDLPAFVFCTQALVEGGALEKAELLLTSKGYRLLGFEKFKLPGSDALAFVGKTSRSARKALAGNYTDLPGVKRLTGTIRQVLDSINLGLSLDRLSVQAPFRPVSSVVGGLLRLCYPAIENKMMKKLFADTHCTRCKKCERICPVGNIQVQDIVQFFDRCVLCMRCVHQCPAEAIQIGKSTSGKFRWHGPDKTYDPEHASAAR